MTQSFPLLKAAVFQVRNKKVFQTIKPAEKAKRITYKEEDKVKITKYANLYYIANSVRRYSKEFPNISESTVRGWLKKFCGELTLKVPSEEVVISKKRIDKRFTCQRSQMKSFELF